MTTNKSSAEPTIERFIIRHYRDNGQTMAYCHWSDRGRTSANIQPCYDTRGRPDTWSGPHTLLTCTCHSVTHMMALAQRAIRDGIAIETEVW